MVNWTHPSAAAECEWASLTLGKVNNTPTHECCQIPQNYPEKIKCLTAHKTSQKFWWGTTQSGDEAPLCQNVFSVLRHQHAPCRMAFRWSYDDFIRIYSMPLLKLFFHCLHNEIGWTGISERSVLWKTRDISFMGQWTSSDLHIVKCELELVRWNSELLQSVKWTKFKFKVKIASLSGYCFKARKCIFLLPIHTL